MRLMVDTVAGSPSWNMAVDEALLVSSHPLTLRFYGWQPFGISLGHFQNNLSEVELRRWQEDGIDVVRRLTGGGAILHGREVTYCLTGVDGVFPFDQGVEASYRLLHDAIIRVVQSLGVPAGYASSSPPAIKHAEQPFFCYARTTKLDVVAGGKKLVGSAKRRRGGRALQHGSIILEAHPQGGSMAALSSWIELPRSEFECRSLLAQKIADELGFGSTPGTLTPVEHKLALELELIHYKTSNRR